MQLRSSRVCRAFRRQNIIPTLQVFRCLYDSISSYKQVGNKTRAVSYFASLVESKGPEFRTAIRSVQCCWQDYTLVYQMICDELSPECVMLIYLSASGGPARDNVAPPENSVGSSRTSNSKLLARASQEHTSQNLIAMDKNCLVIITTTIFGLGSNNLYPGDLIPFTRKPLFLIIDSDTSRAFKAVMN